MQESLFNEDSGYYRITNPIGKNSDFITAPEISQVFGELVLAYLIEVFFGKNPQISLIEMGAGRGVWFYDILNSLKKLADKNIPQAIDFKQRTTAHIIEINQVLKQIQQEKLSEFAVTWHKDFSAFIQTLDGQNNEIIFLSNELFDCFPIDQYIKTDIGWCERVIDSSGVEKKFILANFDPKTHQFVENELGFEASQSAPFGAVFEYSYTARNFMEQLSKALRDRGGMAIIIDYGYEKTEFANTLQSIKNHQKVDVLKHPGESDITALVDFSSLVKIAKNYNLNFSLISQKEFFLGLGIEERKQSLLQRGSEKVRIEIESAINRIIDPNQMGELFKVLLLWK